MRWRGRRTSTNVDDRRASTRSGGTGRVRLGGLRFPRGRSGAGLGGGRLGIGGVLAIALIVGAVWVFTGGDLGSILSDGPTDTQTDGRITDDPGQFIATVLAETEDTWGDIFANSGRSYLEPTLVLFSGSTSSACGFAAAATGPFYCPADHQIYIDLSFYDELARRFGAPGDFAQAYVLAHEVGHHVQQMLGVLGGQRAAAAGVEANFVSIQIELQADCYAGVWAYYANADGLLEIGDIDEAMNAAAQVGDDAIQLRERGYVVPESFNHGSSEQRARWFLRGYESGDPNMCDTFSATAL